MVHEVPDGDLLDYADDGLFSETLGSLETHARRKSAVGHPLRYAILYLLYEEDELRHSDLVDATGREGNALQHHLKPLLDVNLVARIPAPGNDDRRTVYRITTMGKQEVEADIRNIHGESDD